MLREDFLIQIKLEIKFLPEESFAIVRLASPRAKSPVRVLPKSAIHDVRYSVIAD